MDPIFCQRHSHIVFVVFPISSTPCDNKTIWVVQVGVNLLNELFILYESQTIMLWFFVHTIVHGHTFNFLMRANYVCMWAIISWDTIITCCPLIMEKVMSLMSSHVLPSIHISPFINIGIKHKLCWGHLGGVWTM